MVGGEWRKSVIDWEGAESSRREYDGDLCAIESRSGAASLGAPGDENAGGIRVSTDPGSQAKRQDTGQRNPESTVPQLGTRWE